MRILLTKILLHLLSDSLSLTIKNEVLEDWLMSLSAEKSPYKAYYTIRKKAIQNTISIGLEQKDYWVNIGRLAELKQLNTLSLDLIKKYDKKGSKKDSKSDEGVQKRNS